MPRAAVNRALNVEEQALVNWLIANGIPDAKAYASQVPLLRVVGSCNCGCPTINFAVGTRHPEVSGPPRIIADFLGMTPAGLQVGVILFATGEQISELEVYPLSDAEGKFSLPTIASLHPF